MQLRLNSFTLFNETSSYVVNDIAFKFDNCTLIQFYSYFLFYFLFHVYNFHRWWFFLFLCPFSSVHICRYKPNFINWRKVVELHNATIELLLKSLLSQILLTNLKLKIWTFLIWQNPDSSNQSECRKCRVLVNALLHESLSDPNQSGTTQSLSLVYKA